MGLDMYAYRTSVHLSKSVDFNDEVPADKYELIKSWRKHPNLHGWMQSLYHSKGGLKESFNCAAVELVREDLDRLAAAIIDGVLPETSGSYFGTSDDSEYQGDLQFVRNAIRAIEEGDRVFYDAWF